MTDNYDLFTSYNPQDLTNTGMLNGASLNSPTSQYGGFNAYGTGDAYGALAQGMPTGAQQMQTVPQLAQQQGGGFWDSILGGINGETSQFMTDPKTGQQIANPNYVGGKDIASGAMDVAGLGLSAYGMFNQLDQGQQRIDTGNAQLQLSRDEYNENLRQRQAVAAQNKVS